MRTRLLLIAAALIAFGGSVVSSFHFDDYAIFADPALTSAAGITGIWGVRQTRPLTYLTFWANYQVGGEDPLGYHLLNLALHVGAVLLAYECLRKLAPEKTAAIAAAIFAVHPLQAEAVDYVWGRSIVLASLLCLAAFWEWLEGREWIAVAWFAAALLAKEEVAAFPIALWLLPGKGRRGSTAHWAMVALAIAAGARVIYATAVTPGAPAGLQAGITPWKYLLAQGPVILRYLRLLAVPWGFSVDPAIAVPPVWLGVLAWLGVAALAVAAWRYCRWAIAGLLLLLPSSSIFPAADLAADRRMYLPMIAFAMSAAFLLSRRQAAAVAVVVVLAGFSVMRTQVWMTERSLWSEAVARAPGKVRPRIQLARALPAAAALQLLSQTRELAPYDAAVATETGRILLAEGQPDAALTEFGRALALNPRDAHNLNNRGVALAQLGQIDAARGDFQRALEVDPNLTEARQNLQKLPER
jgi:tetratricopeptide (TPR) repeat protein